MVEQFGAFSEAWNLLLCTQILLRHSILSQMNPMWKIAFAKPLRSSFHKFTNFWESNVMIKRAKFYGEVLVSCPFPICITASCRLFANFYIIYFMFHAYLELTVIAVPPHSFVFSSESRMQGKYNISHIYIYIYIYREREREREREWERERKNFQVNSYIKIIVLFAAMYITYNPLRNMLSPELQVRNIF